MQKISDRQFRAFKSFIKFQGLPSQAGGSPTSRPSIDTFGVAQRDREDLNESGSFADLEDLEKDDMYLAITQSAVRKSIGVFSPDTALKVCFALTRLATRYVQAAWDMLFLFRALPEHRGALPHLLRGRGKGPV